jgi:hypothetical protein
MQRSTISLTTALSPGWRRLLAALYPDNHQRLLESLCEIYRAEARQVAQLTRHASQMYYPFFRAQLLQIAAEGQAQMSWLQEQIFAAGGTLPQCSDMPTTGSNSWECLRLDVEEAQRARVHY